MMTLEVCKFANKYARGKIVSVLEGGFTERALISGTIAHLAGLAEAGGWTVDDNMWRLDILQAVGSYYPQLTSCLMIPFRLRHL